MVVRNTTIDFFSAVKISTIQDTTRTRKDSLLNLDKDSFLINKNEEGLINVGTVRQFNLEAIDSILRRTEERDAQISKDTIRDTVVYRPRYRRKIDTAELLYKQFGIAEFPIKENLDQDPFNQNVLYNFQSVKPAEKKVKQNVFIETETSNISESISYTGQRENKIKPQFISNRIQFDWITILLIVSLLLIGWVRLFNKKYLVSLIKSTVLYKESNTLYREKNSVMVKASFLINVLFISNISVFGLQLKHFYNFSFEGLDDYLLYFILFASFIGLNVFRFITSSSIGYLFLKQKIFLEYIHNVNIFTKNTGLFLFPVIVVMQFLPYDNLDFIIYTGIAIVIILYLFQLIRCFQIIIRKNLSIFFMILYLCAFEFAPFLVIYKMLLSQ